MTYYTGKDLARSFRTVRKNTIQAAHDIPEEQYGFRAHGDTRSVGQMLAHIAAISGWQHKLHGVDKRTFMAPGDWAGYIGGSHALETSLTSKKDILHALESEGEAFATFLEHLSDASLAETVSFPPPAEPASKTRFEMLMGVKEHEMHHRAQVMLLQRLVGIVPHLTRQRLARS